MGKIDTDGTFFGYLAMPQRIKYSEYIDPNEEFFTYYQNETWEEDEEVGYHLNAVKLLYYAYVLEQPDEDGCSFYRVNMTNHTAYGYRSAE